MMPLLVLVLLSLPPEGHEIQAILAHPHEDQKVRLEGRILEPLRGEDLYRFADPSGEMVVEIERKLLRKLPPMGPETVVILEGDVEIKRHHVEIEVERIWVKP